MVIQRRLVFGPEDVKAVTLSCRHCPGEFSWAPQERVLIPRACPLCDRVWENSHDWRWLVQFVQLTKYAAASKPDMADSLIDARLAVDAPG